MTPRPRTAEELAEDIDEIKSTLRSISDRLDARYVPRELYEARHQALRSEVALEMANLKIQQEADRKTAEAAKGLSMWALGLIATAVVIALVGFLQAGGTP